MMFSSVECAFGKISLDNLRFEYVFQEKFLMLHSTCLAARSFGSHDNVLYHTTLTSFEINIGLSISCQKS